MSELVERVARGLYEHLRADDPTPTKGESWDTIYPEARDEFRRIVRFAILAMREPTEEMVKAAGSGSYSATFSAMWPAIARELYTAMIDAALAEGTEAAARAAILAMMVQDEIEAADATNKLYRAMADAALAEGTEAAQVERPGPG